ncbi:hypothetical protein [Acidovorax sp. Leaf78]|uniref:hypothetical protein n=1 Tax=unclassified Acidovorax TaxID=2684926 RepID=UPI0012E0D3B2|nr:hypothetical protein [Acidovorax sp. Leaf78]
MNIVQRRPSFPALARLVLTAAVSGLLLAHGSLLHAQVIAKKIAVYTDSIGDGGNVGGNATTAAGNGSGPVSQFTSYPAHGASSSLYDLAWRIFGASGASTYDAQQFGGSSLVGMVNGYRMGFATNPPANVSAWGGLTLVQHAAAIQADTVIIHLGGNDGPAEGVHTPTDKHNIVAYLIGTIGKQLAAEGRRLVVIEAPYTVPEDTVAAALTLPPPGWTSAQVAAQVSAWQTYFAATNTGIDAGVAEVNAHYPGFAIRSNYWSDGTVAMNPGTTHEGLHPTLATHSAIAAAVAADVKAFRGW